MSAIENLQNEVTRLFQQLNENDYSGPELEELYDEINDIIRQLTKLRGQIFNKHFTIQAKSHNKNS
jgi:hypothetical protein